MDWPRYKALCDRPDVLSRWLLEQTLALLDVGPLADALRQILDAEPLARPPDHIGPAATDMFPAHLDAVRVREVLVEIERAAASGRLARVLGERSQAGFLAAWRDYARL